MNELKNALAKLETDSRTINVFFRNDDVDADEPALRQLLYTFWSLKTPLSAKRLWKSNLCTSTHISGHHLF